MKGGVGSRGGCLAQHHGPAFCFSSESLNNYQTDHTGEKSTSHSRMPMKISTLKKKWENLLTSPNYHLSLGIGKGQNILEPEVFQLSLQQTE